MQLVFAMSASITFQVKSAGKYALVPVKKSPQAVKPNQAGNAARLRKHQAEVKLIRQAWAIFEKEHPTSAFLYKDLARKELDAEYPGKLNAKQNGQKQKGPGRDRLVL